MVENLTRRLTLGDIKDVLKTGDVLTVQYRTRPAKERKKTVKVVGIDDQSEEGGQLNVKCCSPNQWGGRRPWVTVASGTIILRHDKPKSRCP